MIKIRIIFSIILSLNLIMNIAFANNTSTNTNIFPFSGSVFIKAGNPTGGFAFQRGLSTKNLIPKVDDALGGGLISILVFLYQIGDVIAISIFCFMGIKLLITSPQQKAQLKASLAPYFVGLLLYMVGVPLAVFIIKILISFF